MLGWEPIRKTSPSRTSRRVVATPASFVIVSSMRGTTIDAPLDGIVTAVPPPSSRPFGPGAMVRELTRSRSALNTAGLVRAPSREIQSLLDCKSVPEHPAKQSVGAVGPFVHGPPPDPPPRSRADRVRPRPRSRRSTSGASSTLHAWPRRCRSASPGTHGHCGEGSSSCTKAFHEMGHTRFTSVSRASGVRRCA